MLEVWRETLNLEEAETAAEAALALATGSIPKSQENPRLVQPRLVPVLPHALAAAENVRVALAAAFAVRVGMCPFAVAGPDDAVPVLRRALALGETAQGQSQPDLAALVEHVTSAYSARATELGGG